jgi:hypothetical protein
VLKKGIVNIDKPTQVFLGQGSKKITSVPDITGSKNIILLLGSSQARKIAPMLR